MHMNATMEFMVFPTRPTVCPLRFHTQICLARMGNFDYETNSVIGDVYETDCVTDDVYETDSVIGDDYVNLDVYEMDCVNRAVYETDCVTGGDENVDLVHRYTYISNHC